MRLYERQRLKRLLIFLGLLIFIGIQYLLIWQIGGIGLPCMFYEIFGLSCPGCGISRMLFSLLRLDIRAAFRYNAGILTALPVMAVLFIWLCIQYVRKGTFSLSKKQNCLTIGLIIWLLLFALLRNLPAFSFLSP